MIGVGGKALVCGVSRDTVKSHQKFAAKYSLPFPLLADEGGAVAQRYGVWVEKSMYGKTYMTLLSESIREGATKVWVVA
jgi:thioredoxin-dependent peroxiredoxin